MMNFKNDKERTEFLEDYRNIDNGWYLWREDYARQLRIFQNDLASDLCFLVEEHLVTLEWPKKHQAWAVRERYIVNWEETGDKMERGMRTFADQRASKSQQLAALKEFQKRGQA